MKQILKFLPPSTVATCCLLGECPKTPGPLSFNKESQTLKMTPSLLVQGEKESPA